MTKCAAVSGLIILFHDLHDVTSDRCGCGMLLSTIDKALCHTGNSISADISGSVVDIRYLFILSAVLAKLYGRAKSNGHSDKDGALGSEDLNSGIVRATHIKAEQS